MSASIPDFVRRWWNRDFPFGDLVVAVLKRAPEYACLRDTDLRRRSRELKFRLRSGVPARSLLPDVYALAIEATDRTLGLRHYPVQIVGAIVLFEGGIAEMQTGEGKTITAVLPAALRAMAGRGVHIITANEYLARRDAAQLAPIYERMELSAGCVTAGSPDDQRRDAYACDITYGTASEVGFDFLRDRLKAGAEYQDSARREIFHDGQSGAAVQRGQFFALIDEADSILIDEARTPLIIGMEQRNRPASVGLYRWADRIADQLDAGADFLFDTRRRQSHLTEAGARKVTLIAKPTSIDVFHTERIYQHVEKSLTARHGFSRDKDYVVVDDEVSIVDESTGRIMEGRKWQEGLHQAVEAKEGVPVTPATTSAARITIQSLFRRYQHLAGMTGTAAQVAGELRRVYSTPVTIVPTHRPCIREGLPPRIFESLQAKYAAVTKDVARLVRDGRAVLIGTPSVAASELLSRFLQAVKVEHVVLNARQHAHEAEVVAAAGQPGRVTIATNMAGRGTDIELHPAVAERGGLHVIATEMHSSARIDRQLVGRCARQGDPGSFQFFLSLEDELLRTLEPRELRRLQSRARPGPDGVLASRWLSVFRSAQRRLERLHAKQRQQMLKHEKQQLKRFHSMGLDPFLELVES
jgi:preprotein translocase subunit SecA